MRVSFSADAGYDETPTSAATTAVAPGTPPAKPGALSVAAAAGALGVAVDWDDIEGEADYLVRWRVHGPGKDLNDGVGPTSSDTRITVADYGKWEMGVEACNEAGCGPGVAQAVAAREPQPVQVPAGTVYQGHLGEALVELSLRRIAPAALAEDASGQSSRTRSASEQSEQKPQTTSVVYVIGDSGSMDGDFPEVRTALRQVRGTATANTKVALFAFETEPTTVFELTDHSTDATTGPWTDAPIDSFGGRRAGTEFEAPLENAKALLGADETDNKRIISLTYAHSNANSWSYADVDRLRMPDAVRGIKDTGIIVDTIGFGDYYSYHFPRLEQIATDTGGEHREARRPPQCSTNDPAVTAASIAEILEGTVADNTATLFQIDYSFSLRRLWAVETDWEQSGFDYTLIDGALNAPATKTGDASGTARQVGLATFIVETTYTSTDPENHPRYKVIPAIATPSTSSSLIIPDYRDLDGAGSTDINHALQQAYSTLSGVTVTNKRVVLIADGTSAVDVQDSTLDSCKNYAAVTLDVVAWADHADQVQLKTWAHSAIGNFSVAKTPPLAPIRFGGMLAETSAYWEAAALVGWECAKDPVITKHQHQWEYLDDLTREWVKSEWTDMPGTGSSANWCVITGLDYDETYYLKAGATLVRRR